jgi:hypothetical protein
MQVVKVIHFDFETKKFEPVALVKVPAYQSGFNAGDTDALEYAFTRTQNIFGSWSKGPQFEDGETNEDYSENVEVIAPLPTYLGRTLGHRSSMVGDLFAINGNIYICKGIGFELYEKELV